MSQTVLGKGFRVGFYSFSQLVSASVVTVLTGVRHINVPDGDRLAGSMLACNHQSYLDPVLVGMALERPINYLARSQLFEIPGFGPVISMLGAHPVRQGAVDRGALRTVISLLRSREPVLLFPEGTRSRDGELEIFQPGIASLALRCKARVIPVCIEGAFRSWPRERLLPLPARVAVMYGDPISAERAKRAVFMRQLHDQIAAMQRELRAMIGR